MFSAVRGRRSSCGGGRSACNRRVCATFLHLPHFATARLLGFHFPLAPPAPGRDHTVSFASHLFGASLMHSHRLCYFSFLALLLAPALGRTQEDLTKSKWLQATAYVVPKETATEGEGYFSIIEGLNRRL